MEYIKLGASGLNVSRLILGSMGFGSLDWQDWVLEEQEALKIIQHAYEAGINTWDTADTYSHGRAEEIFGAALKKMDIPRHKVVILTKCGFLADPSLIKPRFAVNDGTEFINEVGLSRKHIFDAVDASVKRLGTYIDVLQIHRFDRYTPGEEIMRALNDVIESGKVRYIGACSMATWEFQMLQGIAERQGWHKFISMQNYYNLLYREEEREMIPYCNATGVGILPYSPLARGILARESVDRENTLESIREKTDMAQSKFRREASQADEIIIARVKEIAVKKSVSMATIALAWILARSNCCPVIGLNAPGRTMEALGALKQKLTGEEIVYLEEGYRPKSVQGH